MIVQNHNFTQGMLMNMMDDPEIRGADDRPHDGEPRDHGTVPAEHR
jgi:hypothetical protein